MRRTALLATLIAASLVLSGCLSDGDDDVAADEDQDTGISGQAGTDANNTASDPGPEPTNESAANTKPTAELTADRLTGEAPLLVTFTITGEDVDGDALTWSLDADGDGTLDGEGDAVPATYEHNFTEAGNYTALLSVSDGTNSTEAHLNITVAPVEAPAELPDTITISDTITGAFIGAGYAAVEEKSHNWSFDGSGVRNMTVSVSHDDPTTLDLDWTIFAPDGTEVVSRASFNTPVEVEVPTQGTLSPEEAPYSVTDTALLKQSGDWLIEIYPGESVEGGYTVTITFA